MSDLRDEFLEQAVVEWAGTEPKASVEWVRQIPLQTLRNRLMGAAALGVSTEHPIAGARLAAEEMLPGAERDRAVVGIVQRWVESDPRGAASWVERFPQTPLRRALVETLIRGWCSMDPNSAKNWLLDLPEGGFRTQAAAVGDRWLGRAR